MTTNTRFPQPMRPTMRVPAVLSTIHHTLGDHGHDIAVTWAHIIDQLHDAGWPARTPEGDRRPASGNREPSAIDYADPTGEMAGHLDRLHEVRTMFEDHRHIVETSLQAMVDLARRHRPPTVEAIPQCTSRACANPVKNRRDASGRIRYEGMSMTSSGWQAKPGVTPKCAVCLSKKGRNVA